MTRLYQGVKVLTYEESIKLPLIPEAGLKQERCDVCDGMGDHECECGDTHECRACDGTGYAYKTHADYVGALRSEIEHLQAWITGDKIRSLMYVPAPKKHGYPTLLELEIHGEPS
jgi:hypothetical protein